MPGTFQYRHAAANVTTVSAADATGDFTSDLSLAAGGNFNSIRKQGTNLIQKNSGSGGWKYARRDYGSGLNLQAADFSYWFLYVAKQGQEIVANANSVAIRVYSDATVGNNWAEWDLNGHETAFIYPKMLRDWNAYLISGNAPSRTNGTGVSMNAIRHFELRWEYLNGNSNDADMAFDWLMMGDTLRCTAGTSSAPADLQSLHDWNLVDPDNIATDPGYGKVWRNSEVMFEIWAGLEVGDTTTASYMAMEDQFVYNYQFSESVEHNFTVTNNATLRIGVKDTGDAGASAHVISGCTLLCPDQLRDFTQGDRYSDFIVESGTLSKLFAYASKFFRWRTVAFGESGGACGETELFGCDFDANQVIEFRSGNVTVENCKFHDPYPTWNDTSKFAVNDGGVYTDDTVDFNDAGTADFNFLPATEAANDFFIIGFAYKFNSIRLELSTAGVAGVIAWEYYNGSGWTALTLKEDQTNGLTVAGIGLVRWRTPSNWAKTTLDSVNAYYIRGRQTATLFTTNPVGTQGRVGSDNIGDVFVAPDSDSFGFSVFNATRGLKFHVNTTLVEYVAQDLAYDVIGLGGVNVTFRNSSFDSTKLLQEGGTGNFDLIREYGFKPTCEESGSLEDGVKVYVLDLADAVVVNQTTVSGTIAKQWLKNQEIAVSGETETPTAKTPHDIRYLKYGLKILQKTVSFDDEIIVREYLVADSNVTEATKATVLAYGGWAINHTAGRIELTGAVVWNCDKLYDRCHAESIDTPQPSFFDLCPSVDGTNHQLEYDLWIDDHEFDGQGGSIDFAAGKGLRMKDDGGKVKDLTIVGDVELNGTNFATSFTNLTITGDLTINLPTNATLSFDNVQVSGEIENASANTLTINASNGSSYGTLNNEGTGAGQENWVNTVTIQLKVLDANNDPIPNVRCSIFKSSDDTELLNKDSNVSGIASEPYNYGGDTAIYWRVRESPAVGDRYEYQSGIGTIESGGYSNTIVLKPETIS